MNHNFSIQMITTDLRIAERWRNAFKREGWSAPEPIPPFPAVRRGGNPTLDLVEVGNAKAKDSEILKSLIGTRKPLAAFAFGDGERVSNRQIAELLEAGADDFVYKNLDERVLVAKLKAHMRRLEPALAEADTQSVSCCGKIELNSLKRSVSIRNGSSKPTEIRNLTAKEFDIMQLLVRNEDKVLSREEMLERLWGEASREVYSECVDKHIESLRRKLGKYGKHIRTVYGTGYVFSVGTA